MNGATVEPGSPSEAALQLLANWTTTNAPASEAP
jgi:hypothetical protein